MKSKWFVKPITLIISIALISSAMLSGCTKSNEVGSSASDSAKESSQENTLEPYKLSYYYAGSAQTDLAAVNDELNKMLTDKINATIELHCVNFGEFNDKMNVMLAAGDKMDLCFTSNWTNVFNKQVANGAFNELGDLIGQYGQDITSQMPEGWFGASTINGKIYAVPNIQYAATATGILVRKDLAEKYSLDTSTIKNMSDIEPFLATIKKNEPGIIPFEMSKNRGLNNLSLGYQYIGNYAFFDLDAADPTKVISFWEMPETMEMLQTTYRWSQAGYFPTDAATKNDTEAEKKANSIAVILLGNYAPFVDADYKASYGVDMIAIPLGNALMATDSITATMNAIPKSSENPERAMMFLNLLFGDKDIYRMLSNGISGTHYTKVTDDIISIPTDSTYNASGISWEFGSVFNGFLKYGDPIDKLKVQKEANGKATVSPLMGFNFDVTNVKTELAQLDAVNSEYGNGLCTGAMDPTVYLPQMIEKLKKAGLDAYLKEMQTQIDAWKASNKK